jgi:hypothetical protein
MKHGYIMLSDGYSGYWGQTILVEESLGEAINGLKEVKELSPELLCFLIRGYMPIGQEDLEDFSEDDFKNLKEKLYDESQIFNYLSEVSNGVPSPYIITFFDIANLANYIRENNLIAKMLN